MANATLAERYDALVAAGEIQDDVAQRHALGMLQSLRERLKGVGGARTLRQHLRKFTKHEPAAAVGLYIWGEVGRGKSMLMDLFFNSVEVAGKRRVHFHAFMQEVHARIHDLRQSKRGDPVMVLARQLAKESPLLCFDELQAQDVADATLLYRLFSGMFEDGVVIVATSNRPPEEIYTGVVQQERFAKFIALLKERMQVLKLASDGDYRYRQAEGMERRYAWPLGAEADRFAQSTLKILCQGQKPRQESLAVHGRVTLFTLCPPDTGKFTFSELCELPLGAADYLALAKRLRQVVLTGIPRLGPEKRNEAKRFVTLIDALYEHKVRLFCTAAVPPEELYSEGHGAFEFQRSVSRLVEMQSEGYPGG